VARVPADDGGAAQVGVLLSVSQRGGGLPTALPPSGAMGRSRCWRARSSCTATLALTTHLAGDQFTGVIDFELARPAIRWRTSCSPRSASRISAQTTWRGRRIRDSPDRAARLAAFAFALWLRHPEILQRACAGELTRSRAWSG